MKNSNKELAKNTANVKIMVFLVFGVWIKVTKLCFMVNSRVTVRVHTHNAPYTVRTHVPAVLKLVHRFVSVPRPFQRVQDVITTSVSIDLPYRVCCPWD